MSSRGLTAGMQTEKSKSVVSPVLFVEMNFDAAPLRVWSGVGTIPWDSKTWLGTGSLGKISVIEETSRMEAKGIVLTMDGIAPENISLAMTESFQGRSVKAWLGFDNSGSIVSDPILIFSGMMDVPSIDDGVDSASISVTAENRMVNLLKPNERRLTHEDQQIDYPGDLGLEFVPDLQNKEVRWVAT